MAKEESKYEETLAEGKSKYKEMMANVEAVGTEHAFREHFRAFIELYIQHTPVEDLRKILENHDIHLTIAGTECDLFHESVANEIDRRWEEFKKWSNASKEKEE